MRFHEMIKDAADYVSKNFVDRITRKVETKAYRSFYEMKRRFFGSAMELLLLLVGILSLVTGIVMFLSRFVAVDLVLLVFGLILINIVLIFAKFKN